MTAPQVTPQTFTVWLDPRTAQLLAVCAPDVGLTLAGAVELLIDLAFVACCTSCIGSMAAIIESASHLPTNVSLVPVQIQLTEDRDNFLSWVTMVLGPECGGTPAGLAATVNAALFFDGRKRELSV